MTTLTFPPVGHQEVPARRSSATPPPWSRSTIRNGSRAGRTGSTRSLPEQGRRNSAASNSPQIVTIVARIIWHNVIQLKSRFSLKHTFSRHILRRSAPKRWFSPKKEFYMGLKRSMAICAIELAGLALFEPDMLPPIRARYASTAR